MSGGGAAPALPWEAGAQAAPQSLPPGGGPAAPASPFPGRPGAGGPAAGQLGGPGQQQPGGPGGQFGPGPVAPSRSSRRDADEEWAEEEDEGPQYTWLHYIILVVVAFVLGLLIWKLVLEGDSAIPQDQAAALLGTLPGGLPGAFTGGGAA
ncbi:hypothetical protein APR04_000084 [Promicromonospora umidemergens]|nr:hypothetical protein [Promicromonospora umidemergens]